MKPFGILLAGLLLVGEWVRAEEAPRSSGLPEAVLTMKDGKQWRGRLRVRREAEFIRLDEDNIAGVGYVSHEAKNVVAIVFQFDFDPQEIESQFQSGQYAEVADTLAPILENIYKFIDLPGNNALPFIRMLARSQYRAGRHQEAMDTMDAFDRYARPEEDRTDMRLYRVLALLGRNDLEQAGERIAEIPPPSRREENAAIYWTIRTRLALAGDRLEEAQECAARVVAFHGRSFEWMPAGLYYSAQGYGINGQDEIRGQVEKELKTIYADSPWTDKLNQLSGEILKVQKRLEKKTRLEEAQRAREQRRRKG